MHRRRRERAGKRRGQKRASSKAPAMEECPVCGRDPVKVHRCWKCAGIGFVAAKAEDLPEVDCDGGPLEGEFLLAWSMVQSHGVDGWLRLIGAGSLGLEPHPMFAEALMVFQGELDRLEEEEDAAHGG